ncbi:hypothetical protein [Sphingomonas hankookensis]|uniref:hypothetical protein n=1 Tax=Sphingomonas hankookensis TaxID=563996 RepID=UPI003D30356A
MSRIAGTESEIVSKVQRIVREHVPGANCAIRDYGKRVGCGELDNKGNLHEHLWVIRDLGSGPIDMRAAI